MKIIYFHGFASSGASGTVQLLRRELPQCEVLAPDIPVDPLEALPFLKEYVEQQQPDLLIGTSMGAMYAQQMRGYTRICVNPALHMSTMSKVLRTGEHPFLNRRKDNQKTFRISRDIIRHFNQMERHQFEGITERDKQQCWGLFGINDPQVNNYDTWARYYPHALRFEGEHQLNEKVLKKTVLPLIYQLFPALKDAAPPVPAWDDWRRYEGK